ncbi:MAG: hypothetical protein GWP08_15500 [Nitrospiraceae bacterium]|nr:hypothetical protein [Nitrospiraceae bacterium]
MHHAEQDTRHVRARLPSWCAWGIWAGLTLSPLLFLLLMLGFLHLEVPFNDQWELIPLLEKAEAGTLSPVDLWALHNEHRLVFPRLLMLFLAHVSHWDIRWEIAANAVLGIGIFLVLARMIRTTAHRLNMPGVIWTVPFLALTVFSLSQWQNWFLGWQLQVFMNVLAAVGGFAMLGKPALRWQHVAVAMALGVVATYSFANGMAFWPTGFLVLIVAGRKSLPRQRLSLFAAAWIVVTILVAWSYLYGYERPGYHPALSEVFRHPLIYAAYVLKYLGGPIVGYSGIGATLAGLAGLTALCASSAWLMRQGDVRPKDLAPYWAMALYAIASAMVTGLGRLGYGSEQALSSRYVTLAQLLWVANLALVYLLAARRPPSARGLLAALAIVLLLAANSLHGAYRWTERYAFRHPAQTELIEGDDPDILRRLHPDVALVLKRREFLRSRGLSVFKDTAK